MFDTATLNALYPTQADYVSKVVNAANASVAAGFMLPYDAKLTKTHAMTSIYGLGLDCGYLCVDQDAFPIHPSASLLRDQTELLHYIGSQTPTNRVIQAERAIAIGYTLGTTKYRCESQVRGGDRYIAALYQRHSGDPERRPLETRNGGVAGLSSDDAHPATLALSDIKERVGEAVSFGFSACVAISKRSGRDGGLDAILRR